MLRDWYPNMPPEKSVSREALIRCRRYRRWAIIAGRHTGLVFDEVSPYPKALDSREGIVVYHVEYHNWVIAWADAVRIGESIAGEIWFVRGPFSRCPWRKNTAHAINNWLRIVSDIRKGGQNPTLAYFRHRPHQVEYVTPDGQLKSIPSAAPAWYVKAQAAEVLERLHWPI